MSGPTVERAQARVDEAFGDGRIFLPFVDEDPRTAVIVSKVVLLARDQQIKDPTIIRQLVR